MGRMVEAQRGQIASLKALGFANGTIALHYFKLVTAIALLGSAIGLALGRWFAVGVVGSYRAFFRFPSLEAQLEPGLFVAATLISVLSANFAAATSVYRIAVLPPAEAMRPAPALLLNCRRSFSQHETVRPGVSFTFQAVPNQLFSNRRPVVERLIESA